MKYLICFDSGEKIEVKTKVCIINDIYDSLDKKDYRLKGLLKFKNVLINAEKVNYIEKL